jgi:hypothetical protein
MHFYHYTPIANLISIICSEKINMGTLIEEPSLTVNKHGAVSLTTDSDAAGHGLPDGRKITDAEAQYLEKHGGGFVTENGEKFAPDFTACRLTIKINEDDVKLKRATSYHSPLSLRAIEISGYYPVKDSSCLTDFQIQLIQTRFENKSLTPKGSTWWYYFDTIPLTWVTALHVKVKNKYGELALADARAMIDEQSRLI